MGTNYYHRTDICECCGRYESTHIGKSSAGWTFSFHGTEQVRSWQDWQRVLAEGGEIRDEYGDVVTLQELAALVEHKRDAKHNHTTYCRQSNSRFDREYGERHCWLDPEGNSFTEGEFS